jgi:hypothetical protein
VYKNVSELGRFLLSFEQMVHTATGGGGGGGGVGGDGQFDPIKSICARVEPIGNLQHPKVVVAHGQFVPVASIFVI